MIEVNVELTAKVEVGNTSYVLVKKDDSVSLCNSRGVNRVPFSREEWDTMVTNVNILIEEKQGILNTSRTIRNFMLTGTAGDRNISVDVQERDRCVITVGDILSCEEEFWSELIDSLRILDHIRAEMMNINTEVAR
jgi:hypothetical protein